jgi:hypothetical protein
MRTQLLGTTGVVSSCVTLVQRFEFTDMSSLEDTELYVCREELVELIFLSIFLMGFHMVPPKY